MGRRVQPWPTWRWVVLVTAAFATWLATLYLVYRLARPQ